MSLASKIEDELAKEQTDKNTLALVRYFWSIDEDLDPIDWYVDRIEQLEKRMEDEHGWTRDTPVQEVLLDELTAIHTACNTFQELCQMAMVNGYTPTLSRPEVALLADAFDACQERWGSEIRAWRG